MEDDRQVVGHGLEGLQRVVLGGPGVDDERSTELDGDRDLRTEQVELPGAGRVVPVVVQPRLADCHRLGAFEENVKLVELGDGQPGPPDADGCPARRQRPSLARGDGERRTARFDAGADGHDPLDAGRSASLDELVRGQVAGVEVRVGVDHSAVTGESTRGKRGGAGSIPPTGSVSP